MKELWRKPQFRLWIAIVGVSTLVLAAAYTMVQQSTRLAANDLPLTTAQIIKKELESGAAPTDAVPALEVDLKTDTSVFVIITDQDRHVVASSATLNGKMPLPPAGVFAYTKAHGSDDITWQPNDGVRLAAQILTYKSSAGEGFIIAGQSLKHFEDRVATYNVIALGAWLAVLAWSFVTLLLPEQLFAGWSRAKTSK